MNDEIKKLTIKNNVKIVESLESKYIIKKTTNDIKYLYDYLSSRNFNSYPKIIGEERNAFKYEFVEEIETPREQKAKDLIDLVSELHAKTTYYKEVGKDKYKEIYEKLKENVNYIKMYYNNLMDTIDTEVYMSPSHYLIARNFSRINSAINFCEKETEEWYKLVEEKEKQRVSIVHNNLETSHYIRGKQNYLISWDNYLVDTPVLDLYIFYKKEALDLDFSWILKEYQKKYKLLEDEKKLLFILISMPQKFDFEQIEIINTKNVRIYLDYLYKTNDLITPYYSEDNPKEEENQN